MFMRIRAENVGMSAKTCPQAGATIQVRPPISFRISTPSSCNPALL
jgi:hypothetical protein